MRRLTIGALLSVAIVLPILNFVLVANAQEGTAAYVNEEAFIEFALTKAGRPHNPQTRAQIGRLSTKRKQEVAQILRDSRVLAMQVKQLPKKVRLTPAAAGKLASAATFLEQTASAQNFVRLERSLSNLTAVMNAPELASIKEVKPVKQRLQNVSKSLHDTVMSLLRNRPG